MLNAISNTAALLPDGSVIEYRDADPSHIRQARFQKILDVAPLEFEVTMNDGSRWGVDLIDGSLIADGQRFTPPPIDTPRRLIYYKRMEAGADLIQPLMRHFVVGWQTTLPDGRNLKFGLKVDPSAHHWDITEDI
jgi:hypothetical protein